MRIKICKECKHPIEQCSCSNERKQQWKEVRSQELLNDIKRIENSIEFTEDRLTHKDEILRKYQQQMAELCYEKNSFEIDDDIADVIFTLWEKGYRTSFCCSGHPENENYGLYISFAQDYYFDFTAFPFEAGWAYTRYSGNCIRLNVTQKLRKLLSENGIDLTEYFLHQRELLKEWVNQLPPARIADRYENLPGLKISSSKIPACDFLKNWKERKDKMYESL